MAILKDVSESLKDILHKNIPELSDEKSIVFDSPSDIKLTLSKMLSIFLYQVVENSYLRNVEREPIGIDQMKYPPLILDLHYIFVPYAGSDTELIILEKIMQMFHDNPVLKGDMLRNSLKGSGNDEIRIIPDNLTFEEINKLWERFPNKPFKLSASYILTPVRIPSKKEPEKIKRVMEKEIDIYMLGADK